MLLNEIMKLIDAGYTKEEIKAFTETKPETKPEETENMSVKDLIRQVIDEVQSENRGTGSTSESETMSVDDFLKKVIEEGR